jgi:hypothetical protein
MTLAWIGAQFSPQSPGFWLLISFLLTALLLSVKESIPARWRQPLWLAHWLIVPYLGLLLGGLSLRLLGITGIDWLASLGLGLGLVFGIVMLLVLVRAAVDLDSTPASPLATGPGAGGWRTLGDALLWSGGAEFHWVFLRGALEETLLLRPEPLELPAYWAIWCAALLAALEIGMGRPRFVPWLLQMTTLVTTSILFFYTHNFWLCWALHTAVQAIGHSSPGIGHWPLVKRDARREGAMTSDQ